MCQPLLALPVSLLPALEETTSRLGGTDGPDLTRYFVVCGTLLLVTAAVAWGFRRLMSGNLRSRATKRSLQVMDVLPLGGKKRLAVVRCYDRTFVLGLGDREVSPVAELDPVIAPKNAAAPSTTDRAAFAQALEQVRGALPETGTAGVEKALEAKPARTVKKKKKVRRRKVKPVEQTDAKQLAGERVVAEAARKMARVRKASAQSAPKPPPTKITAEPTARPRTVEAPPEVPPSIQRLEGLLG